MYSIVVMAAFATAPEMNAGLFSRRRSSSSCCAPVACCAPSSCCETTGTPSTPSTVDTPPATTGEGKGPATIETPPKKLPKVGAVKGQAFNYTPELKKLIEASPNKAQIYDYLNNTDAPIADRQAYAAKLKAVATTAGKDSAPIDIPADLKKAIESSDQKDEILQYLRNAEVPRDKRIQFLNTVRQQLLPATDTKKKGDQ